MSRRKGAQGRNRVKKEPKGGDTNLKNAKEDKLTVPNRIKKRKKSEGDLHRLRKLIETKKG